MFGSDLSCFTVKEQDKNNSPLIETIMMHYPSTWCVRCEQDFNLIFKFMKIWRRIRENTFFCIVSSFAGVKGLNTTGKGNAMEVATYVKKTFVSELSGNVIDIYPVGTLTSKPTDFTSWPWKTRWRNNLHTLISCKVFFSAFAWWGERLIQSPSVWKQHSFTVKNKCSYWYLWFHKEPLTSIEFLLSFQNCLT